MALSMGKFLPERMKQAIMHQLLIIAIQTVEFSLILTQVKSLLLGIAQGVQKAGFDMTELGFVIC